MTSDPFPKNGAPEANGKPGEPEQDAAGDESQESLDPWAEDERDAQPGEELDPWADDGEEESFEFDPDGEGGGGAAQPEKEEEDRKLPLLRRISFQISLGLGSAAALTVAASLVAWYGFFQIGALQREINDEYVPLLISAVHVAQQATVLAGAAPRLVVEAEAAAAAESGDGAPQAAPIDLMESAARLIELSSQFPENERGADLQAFVEDLADNLRNLQVSVDESVGLQRLLTDIQQRAAELGNEWNSAVRGPRDAQVFYMTTGMQRRGDTPVPIEVRASGAEMARLQALTTLEARGNVALGLISDAAVQNDPELMDSVESRFRAAVRESDRALRGLRGSSAGRLRSLHRSIVVLGDEETGAFTLRRRYLIERQAQTQLLERNIQITASFEGAVAVLTTGLEIDARNATEAAESALDLGRALLLALNVLAITSAALILWLFVGRFLVRRLNNLSRAMRRMAGGDLKTKVKVRGKDEIGEMAEALEVFRQNALEVQRLNLIEELLAREEQQKRELETTLEDLRTAQNQMVMQEKLASLGQLTAGIAHEIKNPLNFVNNFAELSNGLLEDLNAELATAAEHLPEETREEIEEIQSDLSGNLERINHHGKRASSIVHGMLEHARKEGGATRPIAINSMLDEYVALAFHSMRAVDNTFQMTIEKHLSEDVGEVEAVPQDISRVFLNIVTNACQATLEKQRSEDVKPGYQPRLTVTSQREGEQVEVRIRDNGPGIPESHIAKIFEPFFTTKDTDKGTGLGLSLSHDIVRGHGGTLEVHSKVGEGAEFVVTLPVGSAAPDEEAAAAAV